MQGDIPVQVDFDRSLPIAHTAYMHLCDYNFPKFEAQPPPYRTNAPQRLWKTCQVVVSPLDNRGTLSS